MTYPGATKTPSTAPVASVLLDTNVWLGDYIGWRDGSKDCRRLIDACLAKDIALLYAMTSIKDVYYLICHELKRPVPGQPSASPEAAEEVAWGCVQNMRAIATAVGADEADLWEAEMHHRVHRDLEDNLVVAAARRARASYLVTRDKRLLAKATVPCVSPSDMLALLGE